MVDDLVRPDDTVVTPNLNNFADIHHNFAMHCKNDATIRAFEM